MINLDIRITLIGQTDDDLIIEFSVPDEWTNTKAISKRASVKEFIEMYECITPDTVQDVNDSVIMSGNFNA